MNIEQLINLHALKSDILNEIKYLLNEKNNLEATLNRSTGKIESVKVRCEKRIEEIKEEVSKLYKEYQA